MNEKPERLRIQLTIDATFELKGTAEWRLEQTLKKNVREAIDNGLLMMERYTPQTTLESHEITVRQMNPLPKGRLITKAILSQLDGRDNKALKRMVRRTHSMKAAVVSTCLAKYVVAHLRDYAGMSDAQILEGVRKARRRQPDDQC